VKNIYAAPSLATYDVVHATLSAKLPSMDEIVAYYKLVGSPNLGFGL
jgi:hypothetical protein